MQKDANAVYIKYGETTEFLGLAKWLKSDSNLSTLLRVRLNELKVAPDITSDLTFSEVLESAPPFIHVYNNDRVTTLEPNKYDDTAKNSPRSKIIWEDMAQKLILSHIEVHHLFLPTMP